MCSVHMACQCQASLSVQSCFYCHGYRSRFGGGSGPIHLDGVVCRGGGQPHLLRCDHGTLGQPSSDCTHDDDISVECCELEPVMVARVESRVLIDCQYVKNSYNVCV